MSATVPSASDRESSRMKLLFHGSGDHNGNAFQFSSSSSSSHSSPESLHSPVRLHIGQEESPEEDYDVLEFTLTTAMREDEQMVMISKWVQDENMMAVKTLSGEMSEENSVYLDANQFCSESWNCNDRTDADDSPSKTNSLPSSSTPDSDATEVPAADDEDDDLEEALFVSVSSDVVAGTGVILMKLLDSELVLAGQTGTSERKSEPSNSPCLTCPDPEMSKSTSVSTKPFESSQAARETSTKQLTGSLTRTTPYHHNRTRMFDPTKASKTDLTNGKTKTTSTHSPTKPGQNKLEKKTAGQTKPHLSQPMLGKNKEVRTIAQPKRTSDGKVSAPGDPESSRDSIVQTVQVEPQHMNQDLKNAETIGESKQEQRSPYRKVKLGPGPRSFGRSLRASDKEAAPGAGTGPPGPGRPRQSQRPDVSTSVKEESGSCSSALKPGPCVGVPKPSPATMAVLNLTLPKALANQQRAAFGGDSQLPPAPLSKLPVKGLSTGVGPEITTSKGAPGSGSKMNERGSKSTFPAGGHKAGLSTSDPSDTVAANASLKPPAMRIRAQSLQARTMTTGLKSPSIINHNVKLASVHPAAAKIPPTATPKTSPLQRSGSARLSRASSTVDKNKSRDIKARSTTGNNNNIALVSNNNNHQASDQAATHVTPTVTGSSGATPGLRTKAKSASRSAPETVPSPQNVSKPGKAAAADRTLAPEPTVEAEKKNQAVVQLKRLLVQGNRRVEALATVVQHLFREHEEALKQKKELSLQLINLRDELVVSSQCCERLHKEKEEVQVSLKETLRKLQEQHKEDLVQLESRLRNFYQAEWDKVHESYQEEADKCRVIVEKQVDDMRSHYRAELTSQEEAHSQKMEDIRQQHQRSTQELNITHQNQLQNMQKNLRETEASFSEQISELSAERTSLLERLQEEEEWRRTILSDKNLDPHTVYLRQELDSLKVVLELKNEQLHVKEKRLLEMEKLVETNVKLEECFKKVQQENEDYKARMDKHAALSKQLSSEQVKLQQTLQKESKVNKRLSMENEELLWKLHNGDLFPASPRRLSPTSPFASPRNSASFPTAAPVSPR